MEMIAPQLATRTPPVNTQPIIAVVCVSVVAHIGLLVALSSSIQAPISEPPDTQAIQARIIYPDISDYEEPQPSSDEEQPLLEETREEQPLEQTMAKPLPEPQSSTQKPDVSAQPIEAQPESEIPVAADTQSPTDTTNEPPTSVSNPTIEPVTQPSLNRQAGSLARGQRFLQQQQQAAIQQMAEQGSQTYQRQLTSPDLNIPEYVEQVPTSPVKPKIVACDNTAVNALRLLSQIAGGNLKCRDETPIDEFIKRRLEKKPQ